MKRLQNEVAESRIALPFIIAYGLVMWIAGGLFSQGLYLEMLLFAASLYLMVELNNSNALIRIYSRMVSCSFVMLTMMMPFFFSKASVLIVQLCFIGVYTLLFKCYQDTHTQGKTFYAFFILGIATTQMPQTILFLPVFLILMGTKLMAIDHRLIIASIIGLIAPYWFLSGYCMIKGDFHLLKESLPFSGDFLLPIKYSALTEAELLCFGFITVLFIIGAIHFLHNSFKDKIRTRMIYEMLLIINLFTIFLFLIQPQLINYLLGIMVINTSIFIAHFIALTSTKITNLTFFVLILITIVLTIHNLWMPS